MTAQRTIITRVEPLHARWLRLTFADGAVHDVDLAPDVLRGDQDPASGRALPRRIVQPA